MVALVAGEGMMNEAERAALARELEKLVGGVNPDGTPYVDPEGTVDPDLRRQNKRPSQEKIKAIARRLAQQMPPLADDE